MVNLLLLGRLCCWLNRLLNQFWHTNRERFRIILFGSLSQQSGIRAWLFEGFFLCAKMDDGMIKLNSLNYSTWKRMVEDFLYCKELYKPIRLKEKPSDTLDDDWDIEHGKFIAYMRRWMDSTLYEHIYDETKTEVV